MEGVDTERYRDLSKYFQFGVGKLGGGDYNIDSVMEKTVKPILDGIVIFSVVVAVAIIIYSGYTLITSVGEPDKIQKGQKGIVAAIMGMVIVFIARILIIFVLEVLGLD